MIICKRDCKKKIVNSQKNIDKRSSLFYIYEDTSIVYLFVCLFVCVCEDIILRKDVDKLQLPQVFCNEIFKKKINEN